MRLRPASLAVCLITLAGVSGGAGAAVGEPAAGAPASFAAASGPWLIEPLPVSPAALAPADSEAGPLLPGWRPDLATPLATGATGVATPAPRRAGAGPSQDLPLPALGQGLLLALGLAGLAGGWLLRRRARC